MNGEIAPRPFELVKDTANHGTYILDADARTVCSFSANIRFADGTAEFLTRAGNAHDDLVAALRESKLQLEYLADKFQATGTGAAVLARIDAALAKATGASE